MEWYYNRADQNELARRGIDDDLYSCLGENQQSFGVDDIERVIGVVEGFNDGPDWHWLIALKDGRYAYLTGWCDYTGWDCQSNAVSRIGPTIDDVLADLKLHDWRDEDEAARVARASLAQQAANSKTETWREAKDKEFGL